MCLCLEYHALLFSGMLLPFPANQLPLFPLPFSQLWWVPMCKVPLLKPLLCHSCVLLQEVLASKPHCSLQLRISGKSGYTELK